MSKKSQAAVKHGKMREMVGLLESLEQNYTDMLHMFMNTSRRMVENAALVQGMMDATRGVDNGDLRRIAEVRVRLQRSLTAVRGDFIKQTHEIIDNPVFSKSLKSKVRELRNNTRNLANASGVAFGAGGKPPKAMR